MWDGNTKLEYSCYLLATRRTLLVTFTDIFSNVQTPLPVQSTKPFDQHKYSQPGTNQVVGKQGEKSSPCSPKPEIVAGSCQQDPMGLDGLALDEEHHVKQTAILPQRQKAVQQALGMAAAVVFLARAGPRRADHRRPPHWPHLAILSHVCW